MIKAGIFDIGGVMVHPDKFDEILKGIIADLHVKPESFYSFWHTYYYDFSTGKLSEDEFWQNLKNELRIPLPSEYDTFFVREYQKRYRRIPGVTDIIHNLKSQGIRLAILSNMIPPHTNYLRSIGITDGFDEAIFSNEVGMKKPDPKIYELVLNKLNLKPEEAFFVDDKQRNTDAAENLGIKSIVFTSAEALKQKLDKVLS